MTVTDSADVVVVGGGVLGVSTAFNLAKLGAGKVILLERTALGAGGTGRSVATVEPLTLHPTVADLQHRSITVWKHFADEVGGDCGWTPLPLALLVEAGDLSALALAKQCHEHKCDFDTIAPEAFARMEPGANLDGIAEVGYSEDAGWVNPELTTISYAEAAVALGVDIRTGVRATKIVTTGRSFVPVKGDRVVGIETSAGTIATDKLVLAAGSWTGVLLRGAGLQDPLTNVTHPVGVLDVPPGAQPLKHSLIDLPMAIYCRPAVGNRYVFSSMSSSDNSIPMDIEAEPASDPMAMQPIWERLIKRFPAFERAVMQPGWAGMWDMSKDGQPLVGPVEPLDGLWMAAGTSGIGFKLAPAIGEGLAQQVVGTPGLDLSGLSPNRQPMKSTHEFGLFG